MYNTKILLTGAKRSDFVEEIYLDNAATTRCDPQAANIALELMTTEYANPSSLHSKGISAHKRLDIARQQLATSLGCDPEEVVFTSSGTQSNNIGILGSARQRSKNGGGIVGISTMHPSAIKPIEYLGSQGMCIDLLPPKPDGSHDIEAIANAVAEDTILLVCDFVNSEVGSIAPIERISRAARRKSRNIHIHVDGVQAFGKVKFSSRSLDIDSMAISGHKIFAPKGCGALYLRRGAKIKQLLFGSSQERGIYPGTENTPAICAFGHMSRIVCDNFDERHARVLEICEYFVKKASQIPGVCMNSPPGATPYICNISIPNIASEPMIHFLAARGIYLSGGSACSKGALSPVLTAMGLERRRIRGALRISFSPQNRAEDVDKLIEALRIGIATL